MIHKNLKNIRAKLKSASSSNNQSLDNEYNSEIDKAKQNKTISDNIKSTEKSLDGEISFNITPDEDEIKRDINKLNKQRTSNKNSKINSLNYGNSIPLDYKNNSDYYTKNNTVSSNKDSDDYDELDYNITTENNEANVYEKEHDLIKKEAKELLEKTEKLMNNLDNINQFDDFKTIKSPISISSKLSSNVNSTRNNNSNQISYNFVNDNASYKSEKIFAKENFDSSVYPDNLSEGNAYNYPKLTSNNFDMTTMNTMNTYQEEKPLDLSKILRKENPENIKRIIKDENLAVSNNLSSITASTNAASSVSFNKLTKLSNELLEKSKLIKKYEKELKERDSLIASIKIHSEKQKKEILILREKLKNEEITNIKNELIQLQKKYKEKEDEFSLKKKLFDNLLSDYKSQIENLVNKNESGINRIKDLDTRLKIAKQSEENLKKENKALQLNIVSFENQIKNLKENFSNEINEKKKFEDKYLNLLGYVKNIFNNLKELSKSKENSLNSKMTEKLKYFYSDKDLNVNNTSLFLSNCFELNDNLGGGGDSNNNNNNSLINNKFEMDFDPKDKEGKHSIY